MFKFEQHIIDRAREWPKGLDTSFWYIDQEEDNELLNDFKPKTEEQIEYCKEKG